MELSEQARKARNEYQRTWKAKNRDKINAYYNQWRAKNKDKVRAYNEAYWERKAQKMNEPTALDRAIKYNDVTLNDNVTNSVTRCLNCGIEFTAKRKTAKFCSTSCRVQYNRMKKDDSA